jgi:hypothetical protein
MDGVSEKGLGVGWFRVLEAHCAKEGLKIRV